jgi:hypothetical protein
MRWNHLAVVSCSLIFLAGCGGSERPSTVPVSGKITFAGGPPPAEGTVNFMALEAAEGFPKRPGAGKFDADGNLTVRSFTEGDGLVPGKYRVRVECWKVPPSMDGPESVSYVAEDYTVPDLVVPVDGDDIPYNLDVKPAIQ